MAATKKHEMDRNFKGRGILKCRICGIPYTKHRIGRCPFADDVDLFYGPDGRIRRTLTEIEMGEDGTWTQEQRPRPS